jgi:hypothetical protein
MSDKIEVIRTVDEDGCEQYTVSAASLTDLASVLGATEDQFVVKEDDKLARRRRLQEVNRLMNTPEAIRRRTNFNPWTGEPDC